MTKISKKKLDLRKKQKVEAAKLGIHFEPNVPVEIKQLILDDKKVEQNAITCSYEEFLAINRRLYDKNA